MCAALLLCCQLFAQESRQKTIGSGESATETRSVGEFNQVDLRGAANVNIVIGDSFEVRVTADDNILPLITTEVVEETLEIGIEDDVAISPKVKISVDIRMPKLSVLRLSGAGNVSIGELQAEPLKVELAGAGTITAQGQVGGLSIDIAGAGDVDFSKLEADEADVTIAGVGNVRVSAEKTLSVSISGVGEVRYDGSPQVTKTIEGMGKVRKVSTSSKSG
jgi:hypothetical protein